VCGKASLDALRIVGQKPFEQPGPGFARDLIVSMPTILRQEQALFSTTGGLHAAAAFDVGGAIIAIREDVGRHNAVDKVVGHLLRNGLLPGEHYGLLVSGRASFELMQKSLLAGIPLLAAIGAPSSLAIQLAKTFNMTLIGFLRDDRFNIYSAPERVSN
jgi:FdhD protein